MERIKLQESVGVAGNEKVLCKVPREVTKT